MRGVRPKDDPRNPAALAADEGRAQNAETIRLPPVINASPPGGLPGVEMSALSAGGDVATKPFEVSSFDAISRPHTVERALHSKPAAPTFFRVRLLVEADQRAQHWVDSGLRVRRGQRLRFTATGSLSLISLGGQLSTPAGLSGVTDKRNCLSGKPTGALVAFVGDLRKCVFVGSRSHLEAKRDGPLLLGINRHEAGGEGSYEVLIEAAPLIEPGTESFEHGHLSEIRDKRRVYVYESDGEKPRKNIVKELSKYRGLDVVATPDEADFAVTYRDDYSLSGVTMSPSGTSALIETERSGHMYVFTRGVELSDAIYRPRVVWKGTNTRTYLNGITFSRHPSTNLARDFIKALKELRGEK